MTRAAMPGSTDRNRVTPLPTCTPPGQIRRSRETRAGFASFWARFASLSMGQSPGVLPTVNALTDHAAWQDLRSRLRPFILSRAASAADADDILQDAMLRMHRGLSNLRDDQRLSAWMFQVARSAIADYARKAARTPLTDREPPDTAQEPFATDEDTAVVLARCVGAFVHRLPDVYREALLLTEMGGLTQREAAQQLGISLSGMKSRVQRGRVKLREMLEGCCTIAMDARGCVSDCEPRPLEDVPANLRDLTRC